MEARFLLDTNTASYFIKGVNPNLDRRLVRTPSAHLAVSAVTEGELLFGVARKPGATRLRTTVEEFLRHVTVLPWDSDCAQAYGTLRAILKQEGRCMGNLDLMIAAHALSLQLTLVTHDHVFSRVKHLKVIDWMK